MVKTVTRVVGVLQTLLLTQADELARTTGLVKRKRILSGSTWVRTLVVGWGEQSQASVQDLTEVAADLGAEISPQGLAAWFCPEGVDCLKQLTQLAVGAMIETEAAALPLLQRFCGVYLEDCTTMALPPSLAELYPGCGGSDPQGRDRAALKTFVRLELQRGYVTELSFVPGRQTDVRMGQQASPLPRGALRLKDLGFFDTQVLAEDMRQGVHWISRVPANVCVQPEGAAPQEIATWLQSQKADQLDCPVAIGKEAFLHCRLLAVRCPAAVRERRLRKLEQKARKDGRRPVSERQRIMSGWLVFITDLSAAALSVEEAWVLYRTRWQIELLFKLWKGHGGIDKWRGERGERVLCEIFAKLLIMLTKHWMMLLAGPWLNGQGALAKARRVRRRLSALLVALPNAEAAQVVIAIFADFARLKRRARRHKSPLTIDLLNDPAVAELELS